MRVLLIEQNGARQVVEDAAGDIDAPIESRREYARQFGIEIAGTAGFEPKRPLDCYTFNGSGKIILKKTRKGG